jgi:hypothetical protein
VRYGVAIGGLPILGPWNVPGALVEDGQTFTACDYPIIRNPPAFNPRGSAIMMSIHQSIQWRGESGEEYTYYIWPRGSQVEQGPPGNFLHVKETEEGILVPVYIGQTEDLNRRLLSEEMQKCVNTNGATQLHLHASFKGEAARMAEQADLMARWKPVCNRPPG